MKTLFILISIILSFNAHSLNNSLFVKSEGKITYVKDGDTYKVQTTRANLKKLLRNGLTTTEHIDFQKNTFVVRLANIDTQESVHKNPLKNTRFGKKTSKKIKQMLTNKSVKFQCFQKGRYDRAVCSVQTRSGDVGHYLIKNRYSKYIQSYFKHPYYHAEYKKANKVRLTEKVKGKYAKLKSKFSFAKSLLNK
jgi:endonuclease YncB( thermonuclease family)